MIGPVAYHWLTGMPASRLTRQSVAALTVPPGRADTFAWDSDVPGFGVKLSAGGSRRWILQYRPTGHRNAKRITIGAVDALPLDEARREARKLLAKALTGADPHAEKAAAKAQASETVSAVADAYLRYCEKHQKPSTFYQTKLHLTKHWAPLRTLPLRKVRRSDVAARLNELRETSGGVSANRSRSALSAMFSWAIGEGLTDLNPVVGTHKPAKEAPRERVLADADLAAIWRACRDDSHGRIVRLLMLTAQRRDEVGSITDAELDLDRAVWTLPAGRSKNGREHVVPLSQPAVSILREAPRLVGRECVFGEGAGGFSGWSRAKAALDARMKAAGTPVVPWTLHDLRRTAATMMADRLGVLPHVIEAVLNHVSGHKAGIAGVYNRAAYVAEKRDALERWAEYLEAARAG